MKREKRHKSPFERENKDSRRNWPKNFYFLHKMVSRRLEGQTHDFLPSAQIGAKLEQILVWKEENSFVTFAPAVLTKPLLYFFSWKDRKNWEGDSRTRSRCQFRRHHKSRMNVMWISHTGEVKIGNATVFTKSNPCPTFSSESVASLDEPGTINIS